MTQSEVSIGAWVAFAELAAPLLLAMLVVGLVAGILQTMTQIREASIAVHSETGVCRVAHHPRRPADDARPRALRDDTDHRDSRR